jgi:peptidoglycan/xylan/chitin deacetylase (PgdA/CDA1 family)
MEEEKKLPRNVFVLALIAFLFLFIYSVFFALPLTNTFFPEGLEITSYKILNDYYGRLLITREIKTKENGDWYYYIDVDTLHSGLIETSRIKNKTNIRPKSPLSEILAFQKERLTPYGNFSEKHSAASPKNIVLTSDLCPTSKEYDRLFYESIAEHQTNISLLVFFSGRWIARHPQYLKEIKEKGLALVAGNHTDHHIILTNRITKEDFISEITNTEKIMLENGILPSCFFRFPALVYKKEYMEALDQLNLIAVNANAWMGTKAKNWSVLLVHSNGCASSEVRVFKKFLDRAFEEKNQPDFVFQDIFAYFQNFLKESSSTN